MGSGLPPSVSCNKCRQWCHCSCATAKKDKMLCFTCLPPTSKTAKCCFCGQSAYVLRCIKCTEPFHRECAYPTRPRSADLNYCGRPECQSQSAVTSPIRRSLALGGLSTSGEDGELATFLKFRSYHMRNPVLETNRCLRVCVGVVGIEDTQDRATAKPPGAPAQLTAPMDADAAAPAKGAQEGNPPTAEENEQPAVELAVDAPVASTIISVEESDAHAAVGAGVVAEDVTSVLVSVACYLCGKDASDSHGCVNCGKRYHNLCLIKQGVEEVDRCGDPACLATRQQFPLTRKEQEQVAAEEPLVKEQRIEIEPHADAAGEDGELATFLKF